MLQFDSFAEECARQGVRLEPEMYEPPKNSERTYAPDPASLLPAIVRAGHMLRTYPGKPLAVGALAVTPELASDESGLTLVNMINGSQSPHQNESLVNIPGLSSYSINTCPAAEVSFAETLSYFDDATCTPELYGAEIINSGSTPVMVRKYDGESSALSLQPVVINGVSYPPGSILRLDMSHDVKERGRPDEEPHVSPNGVRLLTTANIRAAAFRRLSAFAFDPVERDVFMPGFGTANEHMRAHKLIKEVTMPGLREVVEQAVEQLSDSKPSLSGVVE